VTLTAVPAALSVEDAVAAADLRAVATAAREARTIREL